VIRYFAYQYRLDDAGDFEGDVMVKLVDNDYGVLRAFKGQSSFRTYISVVVQHLALDNRASVRGRWRPPVEVNRLGDLAIELYELLYRDGRTLDEAVTGLRTKYEGVDRESLKALAAKLPRPAPRPHRVPIDNVDSKDLPRPPDVDDGVLADERRRMAAKTSQVVSTLIARLSPEDRVILQFRFPMKVTVAQIARMLGLDQKATYRRLDHIKSELKLELERAGITREEILDLIGHDEIFVHFDFGNPDSCQSMTDDEKTGPRTEEP